MRHVLERLRVFKLPLLLRHSLSLHTPLFRLLSLSHRWQTPRVTGWRMHSSRASSTKPPNVLILRPSLSKDGEDDVFCALRDELSLCLHSERYVVYPLPREGLTRAPWKENCALLVLPPSSSPVATELYRDVVSYLERFSGRVLSMDADFNGLFEFALPTGECFDVNSLVRVVVSGGASREGRGDEEVSFQTLGVFSIGKSGGISCEEASGFQLVGNSSRGREDEEGEASLMDAPLVESAKPTLGGIDRERELGSSSAGLSDVLAYASQSQLETPPPSNTISLEAPPLGNPISLTPCVRRAHFGDSGVAVLSHADLLPILPLHSTTMVTMVMALKTSVERRREFLMSVLRSLGVFCRPRLPPRLTHGYLVCSQGRREAVLSALNRALSDDDIIKGTESDLQLITSSLSDGTPVDPFPPSTEKRLSVFARPAAWQLNSLEFNPEKYFAGLKTRSLGQCVIYVPVITSTQTVFTGNLQLCTAIPADLALLCVGGQQTRGKGRRGNVWLSPKGCAMFSLLLRFPRRTRLHQRLPLLQHLVALAVVTGVRGLKGYQALPLMIKWPNDIYYEDSIKLGGIIVTCFSQGRDSSMTAVVGCGVNVSNQHPTMCVNDCISLFNAQRGSSLPPLSSEELFAVTMNKLEVYLDQYELEGLAAVEELYYQHWLHSGKTVRLHSRDNEEVKIVGIDGFGYLVVRCAGGEDLRLQPDGNSFDVMKGLIIMK